MIKLAESTLKDSGNVKLCWEQLHYEGPQKFEDYSKVKQDSPDVNMELWYLMPKDHSVQFHEAFPSYFGKVYRLKDLIIQPRGSERIVCWLFLPQANSILAGIQRQVPIAYYSEVASQKIDPIDGSRVLRVDPSRGQTGLTMFRFQAVLYDLGSGNYSYLPCGQIWDEAAPELSYVATMACMRALKPDVKGDEFLKGIKATCRMLGLNVSLDGFKITQNYIGTYFVEKRECKLTVASFIEELHLMEASSRRD